jgi:uncharacterized protein
LLHVHVLTLALLTLAGFFAGFVDAIAGGGGLIALPALLASGMPPALALGTNRCVGALGEFSAILQYRRQNRLDYRRLLLGFGVVLLSASAGALTVQFLHPKFVEKLIPFALLLILIYLVLPKKNHRRARARLSDPVFFVIFGGLIGFYNGFLGPGTGTFWVAALLAFLAFELKDAIIYAKPLNLAGNLFSIVWFVVLGNVAYLTVICMGFGTFVGGRAGARLVLFRELKLVRNLFLFFVFLMTIGLFIKYYL